MLRYTHDQVVKKLLSNPKNKEAYDALEEEFSLYRAMLKARLDSGKTQDDVACSLKTTKSAISRLENAGGKQKHSPTIYTLQRYAQALGYKLDIRFLPIKKSITNANSVLPASHQQI